MMLRAVFSFLFGWILCAIYHNHVIPYPLTIALCRIPVPYFGDVHVLLHFLFTSYLVPRLLRFGNTCLSKNTSGFSDSITQNLVFCIAKHNIRGLSGCILLALVPIPFTSGVFFLMKKGDKFIFKINRFKIDNWWL